MKTLIVRLDDNLRLISLRQVPDSALLLGARPMFLPEEAGGVSLRAMPAVRISRLGLAIAPQFAARYYDAATVVAMRVPDDGSEPSDIDLVADNALAVGSWLPLPENAGWRLTAPDGKTHDIAAPREAFAGAISQISARTTFKTGDIVALDIAQPPVHAPLDSRPAWLLDGTEALRFKIK